MAPSARVQGQWAVKISSSNVIYEQPKSYILYVIEVHRFDPKDPATQSGWVVTRRYVVVVVVAAAGVTGPDRAAHGLGLQLPRVPRAAPKAPAKVPQG